jgi:methionyl-tRNA formyltransferase
MNFIIITQFDPIYIKSFFTSFFHIYRNSIHRLKGVMIQPSLNKKSFISLGKQMLDVFGPMYTIFLTFHYFLEKILDTFNLPLTKSLRRIIEDNDIPIFSIESVNSSKFYDLVLSNKIELVVSVSASEIFRKKALELPKFGCVNLHNAPLPKYKGMFPNFWQMLNKETYSVLTIHWMTEALDAGQIILQHQTEIKENMSLHELMLETKRKSAHSLMEALDMIEGGNVTLIDNNPSQSTFFSFPTRKEVKRFREIGKKII